ncbi:MAG: glycosyltransferase [Planctomycetaceae bacterium]|nr:glycosyltransferase [Planctomycetaceae bacterium]
MKKILQIIPTLDRGSAEKQMVSLATGLPKDEFEVRVCTLVRNGPLEDELKQAGIPIIPIGKKWTIDPWAYFQLKAAIREFQPDLVHTWRFTANAYGRKAAIECGVPRIVAAEHYVDSWKNWLHFRIDKALAPKTDRFFTNSSGVVDFYAQHGFDPKHWTIIPSGVELPEPVSSDPEKKCEILRELGIPLEGTPALIGIVARFCPQKRIKEAIWSSETLKFTKTNFHTIIFGDGPERERLLRYRSSLGLTDRVHFPGYRNDVSRFFPHFDLLWSPSEHEGQSHSVLEAMSYGIPVVASDIPGNRDLVVDGVTGILIPGFGDDFRRRRSMYVEKSLPLLNNPQVRQRMSEAARERIQTEFRVEQMVQRYTESYRKLL